MEPAQAFTILVNTARMAQSTGKPSLEDAEQILHALRSLEKAINELAQLRGTTPAAAAPEAQA